MTSSTVLVTGAGQGIGRVLAHDLAGRGWRVVVADLAGDRAATVVEEIAAKGGLAEAVTVDVADADSCRAVAAEVEARHGALDGLVNNAALFSTLTMKPFWEIPDDEWDRVLRVNLTGLWLITRALLPALRQAPAASIVNISAPGPPGGPGRHGRLPARPRQRLHLRPDRQRGRWSDRPMTRPTPRARRHSEQQKCPVK